ncbi:MAG: Gfo/Idh/MocA family oxidoreductase [Abditibacteriota bacterium]|nr:Gfo/Idh/MocA family oxidoreductase [Abditibacteriota bacterium]
MSNKIKVGVFGAGRGQTMVSVLSGHPDAELTAVCDSWQPALESCRKKAEEHGAKVELYEDFDRFLEHDMDAVVLANYANEHAPCAVRCLQSGRHVVSEVLCMQNMAEAVELIEAVEESGKVYTYAENYSYFRTTAEMRKIYRRGDIGEFQHGEGEYVHDCSSAWPQLTYGDRDHWRNLTAAPFYCTHSVGPVMTITGLRPVKVAGFESPNLNNRLHGKLCGDGCMLCVQFENGATGKFLPWNNGFRRSQEAIWYCIYGTNGQMETDRFGEGSNMLHLWIQDKGEDRYYKPEFADTGELARSVSGHGGSDFYTMQYFLDAILGREGGENAIDVYTAVDMTMVGVLGYRSILEGSASIPCPDLRIRANRDAVRHDRLCADPRVEGHGPACSWGDPEIPDSVYEETRRQQSR